LRSLRINKAGKRKDQNLLSVQMLHLVLPLRPNDIGKVFQGERWKPYSYIGVNVGIPFFNGLDVKRAVQQKKMQASHHAITYTSLTINLKLKRNKAI
jgi:hypothetical protein